MADNTSLTTSPELVEYILLLRRKWKLIVLITVVFFISGMIYTFLKTPVYQSTSTIYIEEPLSRNNLLSDIIVMQWWNRTSSEKLIAQSRSVATLAAEKIGLDYHVTSKPTTSGIELYKVRPADRSIIERFTIQFTDSRTYTVAVGNHDIGSGTVGTPFTSSVLSFYLRRASNVSRGDKVIVERGSLENAVTSIRENTSIEEMGEMTNILKVSCKNRDPYLASLITNELIKAYIELSVQRMSQEASQALDFISTQLKITNNNLDHSEKVMDEFKRQHGVLSFSAETSAAIQRISDLERTKLDIALKIMDANSLKDMLVKPGANIQDYLISGSDPVLGSMVQDLAKLEIQKKSMLEEYTERYPGVIDLNTR